MSFPFHQQLGIKDCGPTCLKMIAAYYGRNYRIDYLREKSHIIKTGVSMLGISEAAESIGFRATGVRITLDKLKEIASHKTPCILHWDRDHFVVLYDYKKRFLGKTVFKIANPAKELQTLTEDEFLLHWKIEPKISSNNQDIYTPQKDMKEGYALLLEPTPQFYEKDIKDHENKKLGLQFLLHYFKPYKSYFVQLAMGMLLSSIITMLGPFLTQAMIDKGVTLKNINIIYLILIGQIAIFFGSLMIQLIQTKLMLHLGTRINIGMVSDFFFKLFNLPISFFDIHVMGDLMQRIGDHKRIESLLTVTSLGTIFSVLNVTVLVFVLGSYHSLILIIYLIGSVLGFGWTLIFLNWKKKIDYKMFHLASQENSKVIEMLDNVHEIKISNSARQHRWDWEEIQATLYKQKITNLNVGQIQSIGSSFIARASNIVITFISATSVIDGSLSLGGMFAINMVIGQLNSPVQQLLGLVNTLQQAKIGMERVSDVISQKNESDSDLPLLHQIPEDEDIHIKDLSFTYGSDRLEPTLNNISIEIPHGKVTAIVGASGSGKSTLLKLLLRFYEAQKGSIHLGNINFANMHHGAWRDLCGVVMQDGKLFNGTVVDNVTAGKTPLMTEVITACKMANIDSFINTLPNGYMTEIGNNGTKVSMGQKQRILLARALYKNPAYLFLDEATSSLDANNEKQVIENLNDFFNGRTVLIVAHRLSTVKNADQIIVMENGAIVETGTHSSLTASKGPYYELVKNQLELGN